MDTLATDSRETQSDAIKTCRLGGLSSSKQRSLLKPSKTTLISLESCLMFAASQNDSKITSMTSKSLSCQEFLTYHNLLNSKIGEPNLLVDDAISSTSADHQFRIHST